MPEDPVAQLLADPRFKGQPVTWEVTPEEYDAQASHRGRVQHADGDHA
jgi:hypothetical protein